MTYNAWILGLRSFGWVSTSLLLRQIAALEDRKERMREKRERTGLQQYFKHTEDTADYIKLGKPRKKRGESGHKKKKIFHHAW